MSGPHIYPRPGVTTFEWIGGPNDGGLVTMPGSIDRVRIVRQPDPATTIMLADCDALPLESVEVRLERRPCGCLYARWPYDLLS